MQHLRLGGSADPPSVRLGTLAPPDLEAAHQLSSLCKWPHRLEDWKLMLRLGHGIGAYDPDGRLVGTALWWAYGSATASLGMILVDPAMQRRGLGKQLMAAPPAGGGERRLLLYSTDAGRGLYASYGFREIGRVRQHQGECRGPIASPRVRAARAADQAFIHAHDALAFGAPREHLISGFLAIGSAFVIETAGRVSGFAVRRRFGRGDLIGPVVAGSEQDGMELVAASLAAGFNRIDIAHDRAHVASALLRLGMADAGGVVTMVRGDWPSAPPDICRFALASQAFG
jgi:GNAT superfamily N-acetyltransferase